MVNQSFSCCHVACSVLTAFLGIFFLNFGYVVFNNILVKFTCLHSTVSNTKQYGDEDRMSRMYPFSSKIAIAKSR